MTKFLIYTIQTIIGIMISHYIPEQLFIFWLILSLLIGHLINLKNYAKKKKRPTTH